MAFLEDKLDYDASRNLLYVVCRRQCARRIYQLDLQSDNTDYKLKLFLTYVPERAAIELLLRMTEHVSAKTVCAKFSESFADYANLAFGSTSSFPARLPVCCCAFHG